jgi:hypothetical protein
MACRAAPRVPMEASVARRRVPRPPRRHWDSGSGRTSAAGPWMGLQPHPAWVVGPLTCGRSPPQLLNVLPGVRHKNGASQLPIRLPRAATPPRTPAWSRKSTPACRYRPLRHVPRSPPVRAPVLAGLLILLVFCLGFGGWAALAPLSSAAIAPSFVRVESNRKTCSTSKAASSTSCACRTGGDIVQAGQVLIRLDPAQEIGDGMDEGVLVAAGEARDPPAVHVGVLGAGDVDPVGAGGP